MGLPAESMIYLNHDIKFSSSDDNAEFMAFSEFD